ncbi:collagen type XXVI alpha 1 chain [Phyllostomus discolor]|uniref:Collagen type XXVI alpha 1 chain n=1 Tax=Phyllostomus discolor TaxID=89673 RepID=A0A834B077_9CHIR|nr:collagen type XXVI alpha 1 chain [Phyllostomus discolor]
MTCHPPRAPRPPGMRTSSLTPSLSPTRGPGEGPRGQPGPLGRQAHQGLQDPQAPKVTGARQERRAQQGLPASWGPQGPAGFLERWGAPDPLAPPARQAARASLQMAPKVSSTPCSHLPTRTAICSSRRWRLTAGFCRRGHGAGGCPRAPGSPRPPRSPGTTRSPRTPRCTWIPGPGWRAGCVGAVW